MLARELPNATLIGADSVIELRLRPERLTAQITAFVEDCWGAAEEAGVRRRAAASTN
jgi:hypothetical protein